MSLSTFSSLIPKNMIKSNSTTSPSSDSSSFSKISNYFTDIAKPKPVVQQMRPVMPQLVAKQSTVPQLVAKQPTSAPVQVKLANEADVRANLAREAESRSRLAQNAKSKVVSGSTAIKSFGQYGGNDSDFEIRIVDINTAGYKHVMFMYGGCVDC